MRAKEKRDHKFRALEPIQDLNFRLAIQTKAHIRPLIKILIYFLPASAQNDEQGRQKFDTFL